MPTTNDLPALANDRQRAFVTEYTADRNATQAAIRAGYSPRSAHERGSYLLKQPEIRAAVDAREAEIADAVGVTKQWLVERLRDVVVAAMTPTPKTYQGGIVRVACADGCDDCPHVVMEIDGAVAHQALRTLMQHRGMLAEQVDVRAVGRVLYEIAGVDPDALT